MRNLDVRDYLDILFHIMLVVLFMFAVPSGSRLFLVVVGGITLILKVWITIKVRKRENKKKEDSVN